jgi:hypothetical protein
MHMRRGSSSHLKNLSIRHGGTHYCTKLKKWYFELALNSVTSTRNSMKIHSFPTYVAETAVREEAWHIWLKYATYTLMSTVVFHATLRLRTKFVSPQCHYYFFSIQHSINKYASTNINTENHFTDNSLLSPVIQLSGLNWKPTQHVHSVLRHQSCCNLWHFLGRFSTAQRQHIFVLLC